MNENALAKKSAITASEQKKNNDDENEPDNGTLTFKKFKRMKMAGRKGRT
jgi:hypothetical protein